MSDKATTDTLDTGACADLLPVVGIGASAGGLAALRELFDHMPGDPGLAFVVVVHLSPDHESNLPDLLQSHASMPVTRVSETVEMEPNHIYVIPPGCNLTAIDTHLRLDDLEEKRRNRAPIDHFFRTLSETHHETAVGIILTGTGSDGTAGLRMIRKKGGLTIVQDPDEAEHDGMPLSAISSGIVDLVLPLAEIPKHVLTFARTQPHVPVPEDGEDLALAERQLILKILANVRGRTGHDFSRYKAATIARRIRRRMQLHQVEELEDYLDVMDREPNEAQHLFDDLLITVTNFFRDRNAFDVLETDIIPKLVANSAAQDRVRAWSVGCATGEEAYSVAILLLEHAAQFDPLLEVQVFATDIHEASLKCARAGLYPDTIEDDVSPERLRRFFTRENNQYRIRSEVRDVVVFAPHNLMKDPPFSHVDLITCRNVLIYLHREVQQDIISLFHYALNPLGFLVLGSSEKVDRNDIFDPVDRPHSVYRKRNVPVPEPRRPVFPMPSTRLSLDEHMSHRPEGAPSYGALHQKMVEQYAPPSILVNEDGSVVHFSANAGKYLTHPGGEPTTDIFRLVREPLRIELRAGLFAAHERSVPFRSRPIQLDTDGRFANVVVRVQPAGDDELKGFYLVIFDEVEEPAQPGGEGIGAHDAAVLQLEEELDITRNRLQAIIEEHVSSEEEMKTANEELQSTNEELRSTMEELETSKDELRDARIYAEKIVETLHEPLLVLTPDLRVKSANPAFFNDFEVEPETTIGKKIYNLGNGQWDIPQLRTLLEDVLPDSQVFNDYEVRKTFEDIGERVMLLNARRLDHVQLILLGIRDITEKKKSEEDLRGAKIYAESIVETLHEPLLVLTPDLRVKSANPAFFDGFEVEPDATLGRKIYELGNGQWDIPELHTLLEDVLPDSQVFNDYEVRHSFEDLGERIMLLNARRLDHVQLILLGIRDITARKRSEEALRESEERFRLVVENAYEFAIFMLDTEGRIVSWNPGAERILGYEEEDVLGEDFDIIFTKEDRAGGAPAEELGKAVRDGQAPDFRWHECKDGSRMWAEGVVVALRDKQGELRGFAKLMRDETERKLAVEALRKSEERYRTLFESIDEGFCVVEMIFDNAGRPEDYRFIETNPAFERHTGLKDPEGKTIREFAPEHEEYWFEKYGRVAETGESVRFEHQAKELGGRWFDVFAFRIGGEDSRRVAILFKDVTDQKRTMRELKELNLTLEQRVDERTREVRHLASTLTNAEHEERRRIARILHDDLQQLLFGLHLRLEFLSQDMAGLEIERLQNEFAEARDWVSEAIDTTRQLSVDLSPPILKNEGLSEALRWLASQMREKHHLKIEFRFDASLGIHDENLLSLVFQAVRELLFNVVKHAGVKEAEVRVAHDGEQGIIEVIDNGRGFDVEATIRDPGAHVGIGLYSVHERLRLVGGELQIESNPGDGTRVTIAVPATSIQRMHNRTDR